MIFNTKEIQGLIRERNGDVAGNAAATIAGAFLLVPLFFLDTKNAASKEAKGLIRRNQVLAERYKLKNCTPVLEEYKENPIVLDYNAWIKLRKAIFKKIHSNGLNGRVEV